MNTVADLKALFEANQTLVQNMQAMFATRAELMAASANQAASVDIVENHSFSVRNNNAAVCNLSVTDEWEGMTKFVRQPHEFLIVHRALGRVVDGSPVLLAMLGLDNDEHFVTVPASMLPDGRMVDSFRISKYPCAKGDGDKVLLSPSAKPWVNVTYREARAACAASGLALPTESQELALRLGVCAQDINWTGGKVGKGKVYQGIHKGAVSSAQAADYVSSDPDERAWHQLSNGQRIYGLAGNIWTFVFDDVQGGEDGLVKGRINADSLSLVTAPYESMTHGMGYRPDGSRDWSGFALLRGGFWGDEDYAGVFLLDYARPGRRRDYVGFRCTKP